MERTKIHFKSANGKNISQIVKGRYTAKEAYDSFNNSLFQVYKVEKVGSGGLSNEKACQIIEVEGICNAVQKYIDGSEFSDPETAKLWDEAEGALFNLLEHLDYNEWEKENG